MKGIIGMSHIIIALLAVITVIFVALSGVWGGIAHTIGINPSIIGGGQNKVTIFIHNSSLYLLGLGKKTVVSKNNTVLHLKNGIYEFEVGFTTVVNNTAHTIFNNYRLNISETTGMISIKSSNSINILNIGRGDMSISKVS